MLPSRIGELDFSSQSLNTVFQLAGGVCTLPPGHKPYTEGTEALRRHFYAIFPMAFFPRVPFCRLEDKHEKMEFTLLLRPWQSFIFEPSANRLRSIYFFHASFLTWLRIEIPAISYFFAHVGNFLLLYKYISNRINSSVERFLPFLTLKFGFLI